MKWITVKKDSDIPLGKITKAELGRVDEALKTITLTYEDGSAFRVAMEFYSLSPQIPAKPKQETRYKLTGKMYGQNVEVLFEDQLKAEGYKDRLVENLEDSFTRDADVASFKIETVEVPVEG